MEPYLILVLVGLTSLGAYVVGARGLRLSGSGLRTAAARALECVGLTIVFLVANVAIGAVIVLGARVLAGGFVSLYPAADMTLLPLSLLQGLTFQWWRERARAASSE